MITHNMYYVLYNFSYVAMKGANIVTYCLVGFSLLIVVSLVLVF